MKKGYVYILASKRNGTLYIGVTSNIAQRINQHKLDQGSKFASKYTVKSLVYFEDCGDIYSAIVREKQLKKWNREWKMRLIEEQNPDWQDLFKIVTTQ
jgi:putative endonuclease